MPLLSRRRVIAAKIEGTAQHRQTAGVEQAIVAAKQQQSAAVDRRAAGVEVGLAQSHGRATGLRESDHARQHHIRRAIGGDKADRAAKGRAGAARDQAVAQ